MFALEPIGKRTGQKKPDHELSRWAISAFSSFPLFQRCSCTCLASLEHVGNIYGEIWIPGVKSTFWEICIITEQHILSPWCLKGPRLLRKYETSQKVQKGFQRAHLRKCALVKESGTMTLSCEMTWAIFRRQSQALKDSDEVGLAASSSKIKSVRQEKRSSGLQAEAARWGLAQCLEWIGICSTDYRRWLKNGWYRMMLLLTVPNLRCVYLFWNGPRLRPTWRVLLNQWRQMAWPGRRANMSPSWLLVDVTRNVMKCRTVSYGLYDKAMMSQLFGRKKMFVPGSEAWQAFGPWLLWWGVVWTLRTQCSWGHTWFAGMLIIFYILTYQSSKSLNHDPLSISSANDYHYRHPLPGHTWPTQRCKILVPILFLLFVS